MDDPRSVLESNQILFIKRLEAPVSLLSFSLVASGHSLRNPEESRTKICTL